MTALMQNCTINKVRNLGKLQMNLARNLEQALFTENS